MRITLSKRLLLLLCIFIVCFFAYSVISIIALAIPGAYGTPMVRILTVLQDIIVFFVPAVATAVFVSGKPASLLSVDRRPPLTPLFIAACALILSVPVMNLVVWLNSQLPFPAALAQALKELEENANATVELLQGSHTVPNLIMSILIVGILAGVCEEIIFRGALQRIMVTGGINPHIAIWTTAAVFSLMHMQFYGFFPRMLLGAFFGYTLLWTGSLWVPITLHALNNTLYIIAAYTADGADSTIDNFGAGNHLLWVAVSVILTATAIVAVRKTAAQALPPTQA